MHIADKVAKERILKAVADPESVSIFMCIRTDSKSAQTISTETGIPLSTVYRKLDELRGAGLTMTERFTFSAGRKVDFVMTTFEQVRIKLGKTQMELEIVPSNGAANFRWRNLLREPPIRPDSPTSAQTTSSSPKQTSKERAEDRE
jgi:DNA-binding transcriptional ArsR family regulator